MKRYRHNECISEPATAFKVDGRGCLNKNQPPYQAITGSSHDMRVCWMHRSTLECDTNYSPPVTLFVDNTDSALHDLLLTMCRTTVVWNIDLFERDYHSTDTMWYTFNIAMFDTMWCIVPTLYMLPIATAWSFTDGNAISYVFLVRPFAKWRYGGRSLPNLTTSCLRHELNASMKS